MRVLVACEYSGVVRDAFRKKGHDAYSCDLLSDLNSSKYHFQGDVITLIKQSKLFPPEWGIPLVWDLIIAHPPCTYLTVAGNRHYANRPDLYGPAADFASGFFKYAERVAVENPVGRLSRLWRRPDQYIEPWQFGHSVSKKTGLWLKNLPLLKPTNIVEKDEVVTLSSGKRMSKWYYETSLLPHKDRANVRSITFEGIAEAMAEQWG